MNVNTTTAKANTAIAAGRFPAHPSVMRVCKYPA